MMYVNVKINNIKKKVLLLLFSLATLSHITAQQGDFYGNQIVKDMCRNMSFTPDKEVKGLVNRIVEAFAGFESTYVLQPCLSIDNCLATVDDKGRPYILYNPDFLKRVKGLGFKQADMPSASDWNVLHVLAHEVAHHLRNHLTNPDPNKAMPGLELEADETAGYILYLLGAPELKIAQRVLESSDVPERGSFSHPARADRLNAFRKGWDNARKKFPRQNSTTSTPSKSTPSRATPSSAPLKPSLSPEMNLEVLPNYTDSYVGVFVFVKGGEFEMGCKEELQWCEDDERPLHSVTLSDYYLGETEVTQAQWRMVMGNNPAHFHGCDDCPVENVNWQEVEEFISKLNSMSGVGQYRLPTEAEWEYAARGGKRSKGLLYSGSNSLDDVGWYNIISNNKPWKVKQKKPNELGLYDMSGNVSEWCSDYYGEYLSTSYTNPPSPAIGVFKVYRGGSWFNTSTMCRVANREYFTPVFRYNHLGFRLARSI
jgi:formylglycine-generating enzyme required for sulfatase activity